MTTTRIPCFSLRVFAIFHFNLLCLDQQYIYPKSKFWHSFVMNFQTELFLFPLCFPMYYLGYVSFIPAFLSCLHVYFSRSFAPSPPLVSVTFLLHHPRACAWYCPVLWWEGPSLGGKTGVPVGIAYTNHRLALPWLVPFGGGWYGGKAETKPPPKKALFNKNQVDAF